MTNFRTIVSVFHPAPVDNGYLPHPLFRFAFFLVLLSLVLPNIARAECSVIGQLKKILLHGANAVEDPHSRNTLALEAVPPRDSARETSLKPATGDSDPFSPSGVFVSFDKDSRIVSSNSSGNAKNLAAPTVKASDAGRDLLFEAEFSNTNGVAKIELPHITGEAPAEVVTLKSNRSSIVYPAANAYGVHVQRAQEIDMLRNWIAQFHGFHFIAEAEGTAAWKLVVTTDVSIARSRALGKRLTYEANFVPPAGGLNYVALTFADFKPVIDGKIALNEPSLGDANYPEKLLRVRSLAFEARAENPTKATLRLRNSLVDVGFMTGLRLEQAKKAIMEMYGDHTNIQVYKDFVDLMELMRKNSENLPEGEAFKLLKTDGERRAFLNHELSKLWIGIPNFLGDKLSLGKDLNGKVDILTIWTEILGYRVPVETGFFGKIHGKYVHALQIIAMLKDATPHQRESFYRMLGPGSRFSFAWNLAFDSRIAGEVNNPTWWRERYEPWLPEPEHQQQ